MAYSPLPNAELLIPKNYFTFNQSTFVQGATTGWNKGTVTWASGLPSGAPTIGTATSVTTFTTTTTNPLSGRYSLQIAGTIAQGEGIITDAISIDREDQAKVIQGSFFYEAVTNPTNANWSGTSSNTFSVYVYDISNSVWLQPAGVYNLVQSSGQGFCSFQLQLPASISSLRIFIVAANAASGSVTVNFDDFFLGPQKVVYGPAMTDGTAFTPSITALGTLTNVKTYYWRIGDRLRVRGTFTVGTTTGAQILLPLPTGLNLDTTKLGTAEYHVVGQAATTKGSNSPAYPLNTNGPWAIYLRAATTTLQIARNTSSAQWSAMAGTDVLASGDYLSIDFEVPIAGWSSNTVSSADTDTREVSCIAKRITSDQAITSGATPTIAFNSAIYDSHAALNTTTGVYTVPVSGRYKVTGFYSNSEVAATHIWITGLKKNGSTLYNAYSGKDGSATNSNGRAYDFEANCNAGDTLEVTVFQDSGSSLNVFSDATNTGSTILCINRISGPATIAVSETVACRYTASGAQAVSSSTESIVQYSTKDYDTHNAFSTGTWKFTVPVSGRYQVNASATWAATTNVFNSYISLQVNGTDKTTAGNPKRSSTSEVWGLQAHDVYNLVAGDTVDAVVWQNQGGNQSLQGSADYNCFSIIKVGI